jgi:hypothetical protein
MFGWDIIYTYRIDEGYQYLGELIGNSPRAIRERRRRDQIRHEREAVSCVICGRTWTDSNLNSKNEDAEFSYAYKKKVFRLFSVPVYSETLETYTICGTHNLANT